MCGDVSRWAVPSVSLCACRVREWSVCLQNIISRFSLRLALLSQIRIHDTHKEATACPHRSPLTRKEAAAWPACPHRSALTRSHTADTSRISSLGLAPPGALRCAALLYSPCFRSVCPARTSTRPSFPCHRTATRRSPQRGLTASAGRRRRRRARQSAAP